MSSRENLRQFLQDQKEKREKMNKILLQQASQGDKDAQLLVEKLKIGKTEQPEFFPKTLQPDYMGRGYKSEPYKVSETPIEPHRAQSVANGGGFAQGLKTGMEIPFKSKAMGVIEQVPEAIHKGISWSSGKIVKGFGGFVGGLTRFALETNKTNYKDLFSKSSKENISDIWKETIKGAKETAKFGEPIGQVAPSAAALYKLKLLEPLFVIGSGFGIKKVFDEVENVYYQSKVQGKDYAGLRATEKGLKEGGSQGFQLWGFDKQLADEMVENDIMASIGNFMLYGTAYKGTTRTVENMPFLKVKATGNTLVVPADQILKTKIRNSLAKTEFKTIITKEGVEIILPKKYKLTPKQIDAKIRQMPHIKGQIVVEEFKKTPFGRLTSPIGEKGTFIRGRYIPERMSIPEKATPDKLALQVPTKPDVRSQIGAGLVRPLLKTGEGVTTKITPQLTPQAEFQIIDPSKIKIIKSLTTKIENKIAEKEAIIKTGRATPEIIESVKNLNKVVKNLKDKIEQYKKDSIITTGPLRSQKSIVKPIKKPIIKPKIEPIVKPVEKEIIKFDNLPVYAKKAIQAEARVKITNLKLSPKEVNPFETQWIKKNVLIESLKKKNIDIWADTFILRGSISKGPIVIDKDGIIIDGNNRLKEAINTKKKNIEIFEQIKPVKKIERVKLEDLPKEIQDRLQIKPKPVERVKLEDLPKEIQDRLQQRDTQIFKKKGIELKDLPKEMQDRLQIEPKSDIKELYHGSLEGKLKIDKDGTMKLGISKEDMKRFGKPVKFDVSDLKIKEFKTKRELFNAVDNKKQYIRQGYDILISDNHAIAIQPRKFARKYNKPIFEIRRKTIGDMIKQFGPVKSVKPVGRPKTAISQKEADLARRRIKAIKPKMYKDYKKVEKVESPEKIRARLAKERETVAERRAKGIYTEKEHSLGVTSDKQQLLNELKALKDRGKDEMYFHDLVNKYYIDFLDGKTKFDKSEIVSDFIEKNFGQEKYDKKIIKDFIDDENINTLPAFARIKLDDIKVVRPEMVSKRIINYVAMFRKNFPEFGTIPFDYVESGTSPAYVHPSKRILINYKELEADFQYLEQGKTIKIPGMGDFTANGAFKMEENLLRYFKIILDHEILHMKYNTIDLWVQRYKAEVSGNKKELDKVLDKMEKEVHKALELQGDKIPVSFSLLKELRGFKDISKQFILNLVNKYKKQGLTQFVQNTIKDSLNEFQGKKVDTRDLMKQIDEKNVGIQFNVVKTKKYSGIQFSGYGRNLIKANGNKYKALVLRLPFSYEGNKLANSHFSEYDNYFAHIRGFTDKDTLYIEEFQSDFVQGNEYLKLDIYKTKKAEIDYLVKNWERRIIQEIIARLPQGIDKIAIKLKAIPDLERKLFFNTEKQHIGEKEGYISIVEEKGDYTILTKQNRLIKPIHTFVSYIENVLSSKVKKIYPIIPGSEFKLKTEANLEFKITSDLINATPNILSYDYPDFLKVVIPHVTGKTNVEKLQSMAKLARKPSTKTQYYSYNDIKRYFILQGLINEGGIGTANEIKQSVNDVMTNLPAELKKFIPPQVIDPTYTNYYGGIHSDTINRTLRKLKDYVRITKQGNAYLYQVLPNAQNYPKPQLKTKTDTFLNQLHDFQRKIAEIIITKIGKSKLDGYTTRLYSKQIYDGTMDHSIITTPISKGLKTWTEKIYNPEVIPYNPFYNRYNKIIPKAIKQLGYEPKQITPHSDKQKYTLIENIKKEETIYLPSFIRKKDEKGFYAKEAGILNKIEIEKRGQVKPPDESNLANESYRLIKKYAKRVSEKYIPRGKAGVMYKNSLDIGIKSLNNVPAVIHEIVHVLDKGNLITDKILKSKDIRIKSLLVDLYNNYYIKSKKNAPFSTKIIEGFATLVEFKVTDPTLIKEQYNELNDIFFDKNGEFYNPLFDEFIKDAEFLFERYEGLDVSNYIGTKMAEGEIVKISGSKFYNLFDKVRAQVANSIWFAEKLAIKGGVSRTEDNVGAWTHQYKRINNVYINNISKTKQGYWAMDENGNFYKKYDYNWNNLTALLEKNKDSKLYGRYLVARNTHFSYKRLSELKDKDEIKKLEDILRNDNILPEKAIEMYNAYKEQFKEYDKIFDSLTIEDLKLLNHPLVRIIDNDYFKKLSSHKGYSAQMREIFDEFSDIEQTKGYFKSLKSVAISSMKKRKGSESRRIHPVLSHIALHKEILNKASKQIVYNTMYNVMKIMPKEILKDVLVEIPYSLKMKMEKNLIFPIDKDFKKKALFIDPHIRTMLDVAFDSSNIHIIEQMMKGASRFFTKSTTALYAPFIIANIPLDMITTVGQTSNNFIPLFTTMNQLCAWAVKGDTKQKKYVNEFFTLGGYLETLTNIYNRTPEEQIKFIRKENNALKIIMKGLDVGGNILAIPVQTTELVSRLGEYIKSRQNGNHQTIAMIDQSQVTASFGNLGILGGKVGRTIMRTIPFANAPIQILDSTIAAFMDPKRKNKVIFTGLFISALKIAGFITALITLKKAREEGDEEKIKKIQKTINQKVNFNLYQQSNYLYWGAEDEKLKKIRVPNQYMFMGSILELWMANKFLNTDYGGMDYANLVAETFIPQQLNILQPAEMGVSIIPQIFKPSFMGMLGLKSFPKIEPIEPSYLKYKLPKDRYYKNTNIMAVKLGQKIDQNLDISPLKIEEFLKQQFGRSIEELTDIMFSEKGERLPKAKELITKQIKSEPYLFSGRIYNEFYDIKKITEQKYNTKDITKEEKEILKGEKRFNERISSIMKALKDIKEIDIEIPIEYENKVFDIVNLIVKNEREEAIKLYKKLLTYNFRNYMNKNLREVTKQKNTQ